MGDSRAEQIAIGQEGQLIISTPLGKIEEQAPIAYQGKQEVEVEWTLTENQVGFSVKDYNQELPLRIDPVVRVWGTYIGDTSSIYGDDYVNGIDLIQNKVYCVGSTNSTSNIATTGSYQVSFLGVQDAFINSFNHYGEREWGTYYGGAATDLGLAISAHLEGIYVVGNTNSNSNIATTGAFQSQNGEGYLMKFDSTGQKLWGTYYGFNCSVNSVKASEEGVYVVGRADNGNTSFYVSTGAYQTSFGGGTDGFIAKFSHSGNRVWGSLFGSSGDEGLEKVDILNEVLAIVGSTSSSSGIASSGAHQTTYGGDLSDAMIAILDTSGIFLWSSYLGGSARDYGNGVAIGSDSSIVLSGVTNSENNLSTVGSHQEVKSGYYDAFISKFAFDGSLSWSTYYGGFNYEGKTKTEINNGSIFIFGNTNSYGIANNAISSTNSYQEEGLGADAYFAKFSSSGERLFGSYYGGTGADYGSGGGCVNEQTILIAGYTVSNNGIASSGSHQEILGGGYDGFIARFDCEASNDTLFVSGCEFYETPFGDTAFQSGVLKYLFYDVYGCDSVIRFDITIFNSDSTIDHQEACGEFTWIDGNTYTSNNNSAQFTLSSVNGCDSVVTLDLTILNADTSVTSSPPSLEANADSATYQWIDCSTSLPIDSATSQVFVAQNNGSYAVVVTQNGCTDTSSCYQINNVGMESLNGIEASVFPNPSSNNITIQCSGEFDFKVLSIDGKTVLSRSGLDAVNCELAEFPRGQYTIVVSQAGKANQYKVILN